MHKVLILGGDGYLGWPTAMHLASNGFDVTVVDNYYRRHLAKRTDSLSLFDTPDLVSRCDHFYKRTGFNINYEIGNLADPEFTFQVVKEHTPETIIHYAEQPSAPYSMKGFSEAHDTFNNNLNVTFNCIWAIKDICPNAHLIKLGTMGEYGTPNIDIEEGWLTIEHNGRSDRFLYPRAAGSLYHTTKVLDTDLLWFYVRTYGLRVTDLMQGPVYGLLTEEANSEIKLFPSFQYDDIFGTVVNRFLVQAVVGTPLTVYGKGGQTRGYLNLKDTLQCVKIAAETPANSGELRVFNQITETFSVLELAEKVVSAAKQFGLKVDIEAIPNPRKELEEHYYNPTYTGLKDLGLNPNYMCDESLGEILEIILANADKINRNLIHPRVAWRSGDA